jgi:hypothetical protein
MKIALVCPSNKLYMPYVSTYEKILRESNVDYTIIYWDRFKLEESDSIFKYQDKKIGHQRNYLDYYKYKNFVINHLINKNYDKIIVFTLQLSYFLKKYLIKNHAGNYVIDIRDYNKIFKYSNFQHLIANSAFTVISSPGYRIWLPESSKYVINHNTTIDNLDNLVPLSQTMNNKKNTINIATIGVLRHWDVTVDLVESLKNIKEFNLDFHGEGTINQKLKTHVIENNINNVNVYGRYQEDVLEQLYSKADLINTLLHSNNINCRTLLTNRLYNAALYGKPMLSLRGTYLADQIRKYKLGLVIDSFDGISSKIKEYMSEFNKLDYESGRISFFKEVIGENIYFSAQLKTFIK